MKTIKPIRPLVLLLGLALVLVSTGVSTPEHLTVTSFAALGAAVLNPRLVTDPVLRIWKRAKRSFVKSRAVRFLSFILIAASTLMPGALATVMIDLETELTDAAMENIAARTSTLTGTAFDLQQYQGVVKIIQHVGAVSGTSPTLDGKIQDSADGSTGWADVSGAAFTQVTAANNLQSIGVDTRVAKRYIRYVGTIAGTSPSFTFGVVLVGQKQYR